MVCKEEVLTWFKDLDSYKRIDVLCELINMCVPFELRFLGSCVEDIGKHSYQELRGHTLFANDIEKLEKDVMFKNQTLFEEAVRHRVLVNISLLSSRNYSAANWYCKKFLRTDYIEELIVKEKDDMVQNELLLLFTMASRHPAFSFEQKEFFGGILVQLINIRENTLLSKSNTLGYPPGFGYPVVQRKAIPEQPVPMNFPMQPPGLPPPQMDLIPPLRSWSGITCTAPEVQPFPPPLQMPPQPNASPLVSQSGSPSHSRSSSPHRPFVRTAAPVPPVLPPPLATAAPMTSVVDVMGMPSVGGGLLAVPLDQMSQSSQPSPVFGKTTEVRSDDELNSTLKEDPKPQHLPWLLHSEAKPMNGMRFPYITAKMKPTCLPDQLQAMTIVEPENALYQSNSSSNSSPNHTPPGTPSSHCVSTVSTPHGPGRGRHFCTGPPPPCDTASPPPPPAAFSGCTVPYSYQSFTSPLPPNRSMFYNTSFRPAFTAQYPYSGDTFPTYTFPYVSLMYSSYPPPSPAQRTPPGCYNCGAPGHTGPDCTQQNIEDITQKKTYLLDYSPVQSNNEGDK